MYKNITSLLFIILCLMLSHIAFAFPQNALKPGGVAIIAVAPSTDPKPVVYYQSKPVALIKGRSNWLAIIGISLNAKRGTHQIKILRSGHKNPIYTSFKVKPYEYRIQRLTIKNKNKVNPNKKSLKRIEKEYLLKKQLIRHYSSYTPGLNFIKPTKGRDSGRFGLRRILNKQKRNPHSGMDIAAPQGRAVKAAESGKVLYTGDLFFTGKVIYLDHGNGLITLYAHLSKILVNTGESVTRGQLIGKVGSTGRATGPHLHWSVYLNGNAVDPSLFIEKR